MGPVVGGMGLGAFITGTLLGIVPLIILGIVAFILSMAFSD